MSWKQSSNSYPYQDTIPQPLQLFSQPYPDGLMTQKTGEYPIIKTLPEPLDIFTTPYPIGLMNQRTGEYPKFTYLHPLQLLSQPYPIGLMQQKLGEYPKFVYLNLIKCGSFIGCSVEQIQIPSSVKKIGPYAFYNTNIKQVTISQDCEYSETSFPPDCVVYTY